MAKVNFVQVTASDGKTTAGTLAKYHNGVRLADGYWVYRDISVPELSNLGVIVRERDMGDWMLDQVIEWEKFGGRI